MLSLKVDGAKVRRMREQRGLSVVTLAESTGCSRWNIYKIEKGLVQPSPRTYAGLKKALDAGEEELLDDAGSAA